MALAGDRHVGVAIEAELARLTGGARCQRRDHRPLRRLCFLAAEAAAHASHPASNESIGHRQHPRDNVLHFARMLRRGIDQDRAILAGHRDGDLAFQIKMLLAADVHRAAQAKRRFGDRFGGIAADERIVRQHALAGRLALLDRNVRRLDRDFDLAAQRGAPRGIASRGNDREDRLIVVVNTIVREHRLIGMRRRYVVPPWNVCRGDHGNDPGHAQDICKIDVTDDAARDRRTAKRDMQSAGGLQHVVDIFGRALHMLGAAIVLQRLVNMAQRRFDRGFTGRHARASGNRKCG